MNPRLSLLLFAVLCAGCASIAPGPGEGALSETDRIVRLQIFLDEANFGPGKIDGTWGLYTNKARTRYLASHGLEFDDAWERRMSVASVSPIYTKYTITAADAARMGHVPETPEEQATKKSMPYTSLAEFVAERYHSTVPFLAQLNPDKSVFALRPGDTVSVPNVTPFRIESISHRGNLPANPAHANRRIKIDTGERMLDVFEGDRRIATFPITPGSAQLPAPRGDWKIASVATMPWFRRDEKMLKEGIRSDDFHMIPAGPNNPVGILWMGLNRSGIGIHGTNNPDTIGRASSHGCIRLSNWDAAKMIGLASKGVPVRID